MAKPDPTQPPVVDCVICYDDMKPCWMAPERCLTAEQHALKFNYERIPNE